MTYVKYHPSASRLIRPYLKSSAEELTATFEANCTERAVLLALREELQLRSSKAALRLSERVKAQLQLLASTRVSGSKASVALETTSTAKSRPVLRIKIRNGWPIVPGCPGATYGYTGQHYVRAQGLLSYVGYRVGRHGWPEKLRRRLLEAVLANPLPQVVSAEHMASWGAMGSARRHEKLARSLESFIDRAQRRKGADMEASIRAWQADLEWVKAG